MKKNKLFISIFMVIFLECVFCVSVHGASAKISATPTTITVGQSSSITTTINGASWGVNLSGAMSDGYSHVTDDAEDTTKTYPATFNSSKAGTYTIYLSGTVTGARDNAATTVSDSVTITVKEPAPSAQPQTPSNPGTTSNSGNNNPGTTTSTPSSSADLKMLGVTTYDFSGFKKDKTSYNTTVPNDVTSVNVYATVAEAGAKYTVIGNTNLQVGTNKVVVRVTSADGKATKDYNIFVARQSAKDEEITPNVIDEDQTDEEKKEHKGLLAIIIDEDFGFALSPEFKTDIYKYTLKITGDIDSIPLETIAIEEDAIVKVIGNENLVDGKNTITIEVSFDDDSDKKFKYEITVYKNAEEDEEVTEDKTDDNTLAIGATKEKKGFIKRFLESSLAVAVTLFVVVFIVSGGITYFLIREKKPKSPWGDDDEDEVEAPGLLEDEIYEVEKNKRKEPKTSEEKVEKPNKSYKQNQSGKLNKSDKLNNSNKSNKSKKSNKTNKSRKSNKNNDFSGYRSPRSGGRH